MRVEHLENHTARLIVDVPEERLNAAMQRAAKRIAAKVNIPGFRKGKAPFGVVVNYVGRQAVMGEALEDLGNEIYRESLQAAALKPYTAGSLEDIKTEPTLQLVFSVPKAPEVDLGDYRQVRHEYTPPVITDEQVQEALESLRERYAEETEVDRPAEMGDLIKVDIRGEAIHQRGQAQPDATAEAQPAEMAEKQASEAEAKREGAETFIEKTDFEILLTADPKREFMPNFAEQALGVKAGEARTISLSYPADHENPRVAGRTFNITFTVKQVKARRLPELDDEFAKRASDGRAETLADLTARLRADLEADAKREADEAYSDLIFQKIVEGATVRYPEAMVEDYIDDILEELSQNLKQRGLSLAMLKEVQKKDDAALRAEYREAAINRLKRSLVLQALIAAEKISVSAAELDAQIESMLSSVGGMSAEQAETFRRMFRAEANRRDIGLRMVMDRLKERLIAIGRGEIAELNMPVAETQIEIPQSEVRAESSELPAASEMSDSESETDGKA
jgi:trigger factor